MSDLLGKTMSEETRVEFQRAWEKAPQPTYNPEITEVIEDMVYSSTGYCPPIHYLVQDYMYGWEEEHYESGAIRSRIHTVFGVRDGEGREWHENGQLKSLGTYVDGLLEGIFLKWREDGTPWTIYHYIAGKEHGCSKEYRNGTLCMDFMFSHGSLNQFRTWNEDGTLRSMYPYQNDKLHGITQHYNHPNGRVSDEFTYYEGVLHGPSRVWSDNGLLLCEGNYEHGRRQGVWTFDSSIRYYEHDEVVREEPRPVA
jgi:antitoxin component YwqK of YwqJK toxin-antitoxin module